MGPGSAISRRALLLAAASVIPAAGQEESTLPLAVYVSGSLPGFRSNEIARYVAERMSQPYVGRWRFPTGKGRPARRFELRIDTRHNTPEVLVDEEVDWEIDHGTRVELEHAGTYRGGRTSIDAYLEQPVVANPHLSLSYLLPRAMEPVVFERATHELPREPLEIKPHPHGVELGLLIRMLHESKSWTIKKALVDSFSRVSSSVADQVCVAAMVPPNEKAARLSGDWFFFNICPQPKNPRFAQAFSKFTCHIFQIIRHLASQSSLWFMYHILAQKQLLGHHQNRNKRFTSEKHV